MKITFLGTSGWMPSEARHTSCAVIGDAGIVFDIGTGAFRLRNHICTRHVDVFLSHLHGDHVDGFRYLLGILGGKQMQKVEIFGRRGVKFFIENILHHDWQFPLDVQRVAQLLRLKSLVIREMEELMSPGHMLWRVPDPAPTDWRMYCVTSFTLPHPSGGSMAYDVSFYKQNGEFYKRIVFVTDTTLCLKNEAVERFVKSLEDENRPIDLFIVECNFANRHSEIAYETGHTSPVLLVPILKRIQPRKVVLTHVHYLVDEPGPFFEEDTVALREVKAEYGSTYLAYDNEVIHT